MKLSSARLLLTALGLCGVSLVVGGVVLARTMNLAACPLCILQRMVYLLLGAESVLVFMFMRSNMQRRLAAVTIAATAAGGAAIAGYQTWIQRFARDVSCTADQPWWEQFVNWAGTQVPMLFEATGLCTEAGWKFLSLSIAEWSLLIFSAMSMMALRAAWGAK